MWRFRGKRDAKNKLPWTRFCGLRQQQHALMKDEKRWMQNDEAVKIDTHREIMKGL
jgi:hypothetical protein